MGKSKLAITWQHMRRTPYQALAASVVMTLTLFIASVFTLVTLGSERTLRYFETRPQVTAFFVDTATQEQVQNLTDLVTNSGLAAEVKFVSKEEALAIYREQNKDDPLLLEMVTAEILPSSLEVSAARVENLAQVAELMQGAEGVEEVVYQPDVVAQVSRLTKGLRFAGMAILSFFAVTAMLIIMIIVGMRIASRRDEIEILRLLGASNWYVRAPFLLEGAIYGVVGAVLAWGAAMVMLLYSTPTLLDFFGTIPLLPVPVWMMAALLGGEIGFGLVIGSIGSLIALSRFMRS